MDTTPAHHLLIIFASRSSLPASTASELPPLQSEPPKRDLRGNNNPGLSRIASGGQRALPENNENHWDTSTYAGGYLPIGSVRAAVPCTLELWIDASFWETLADQCAGSAWVFCYRMWQSDVSTGSKTRATRITKWDLSRRIRRHSLFTRWIPLPGPGHAAASRWSATRLPCRAAPLPTKFHTSAEVQRNLPALDSSALKAHPLIGRVRFIRGIENAWGPPRPMWRFRIKRAALPPRINLSRSGDRPRIRIF